MDKHRDINVQYDNWWKEQLAKSGYNNVEIAFRGFSSQGDGASYIGDINISKWLSSTGNPRYIRVQKLIDSENLNNTAIIRRDRYHNYVHWNTTNIYFDWYGEEHNNIQSMLNEIEKAIIKDHQQLNKDIYHRLEEIYDANISDEAVAETLIINEYEFGPDGKIW